MSTAKGMLILKEAMSQDPGFAYVWHCGIATAMYDELPDTFWMPDKSEYHRICNRAASRFMKNTFDIETYHGMLDGKT